MFSLVCPPISKNGAKSKRLAYQQSEARSARLRSTFMNVNLAKDKMTVCKPKPITNKPFTTSKFDEYEYMRRVRDDARCVEKLISNDFNKLFDLIVKRVLTTKPVDFEGFISKMLDAKLVARNNAVTETDYNHWFDRWRVVADEAYYCSTRCETAYEHLVVTPTHTFKSRDGDECSARLSDRSTLSSATSSTSLTSEDDREEVENEEEDLEAEEGTDQEPVENSAYEQSYDPEYGQQQGGDAVVEGEEYVRIIEEPEDQQTCLNIPLIADPPLDISLFETAWRKDSPNTDSQLNDKIIRYFEHSCRDQSETDELAIKALIDEYMLTTEQAYVDIGVEQEPSKDRISESTSSSSGETVTCSTSETEEASMQLTSKSQDTQIRPAERHQHSSEAFSVLLDPTNSFFELPYVYDDDDKSATETPADLRFAVEQIDTKFSVLADADREELLDYAHAYLDGDMALEKRGPEGEDGD